MRRCRRATRASKVKRRRELPALDRHYTEYLFSRFRWPLLLVCAAGLSLLYFFGLDGVGLIGPDEPRYAAIGRSMALSGDLVTPRLWGSPWFEKPPLLYWMTAAGFRLGLNEDLAPRAPVALMSVAFLVLFWSVLRRAFGERAAFYAAAMLATSAGWLAFSHVAVTDLPLSATFAGCMLLLLDRDHARPIAAGALLGLAALAKGLVPFVLFLPAILYLRRQPRTVLLTLMVAVLVAAPWYVMVTIRNGGPFLTEFFMKQHFARFTSAEFMHEQPFWFYIPVALALLFPWTPAVFLCERRMFADKGVRFMLAWLLFGLLFFSVARNKLPGYVLPLMPPFAALVGVALDRAHRATWPLAAIAAAAQLLLPIAALLPQAVLRGITNTQFALPGWAAIAMVIAGVGCWLLERSGRRTLAVTTLTLLLVVYVFLILQIRYPVFDRQVSARFYWREHSGDLTCERGTRSWRYSLSYYARRFIPDCK
jgi:4-amino-4-deoxy-L-arabinose transferase-like glycosyltransferase